MLLQDHLQRDDDVHLPSLSSNPLLLEAAMDRASSPACGHVTATADIVASCLYVFVCLQQARDAEFLQRTLVLGLPALGERVQQIRVGKAATLAAENDKQLEKSQVGGSCCCGLLVEVCRQCASC
jgi:hypothetical protein